MLIYFSNTLSEMFKHSKDNLIYTQCKLTFAVRPDYLERIFISRFEKSLGWWNDKMHDMGTRRHDT